MDWFTADTHFGHANIIKYCKRPFADVHHMNEMLIKNWNTNIGEHDRVFHVGDFAFNNLEQGQSIFDRLNGQKHLILGNHDQASSQINGWEWVRPYHELQTNGQLIILCHYSMRVWNKSHKGAWMLYGHSHGNLPDDPNALSIDVGVDCHRYSPISINDLRRIMKKKTWAAVDHHGKS